MRSNFLIILYCWSLVASSSLPTDSDQLFGNQIVKLNKRPNGRHPLWVTQAKTMQSSIEFSELWKLLPYDNQGKNAMDCTKRNANGLKWKTWTQLHQNENSSVMQLPSAANQIRRDSVEKWCSYWYQASKRNETMRPDQSCEKVNTTNSIRHLISDNDWLLIVGLI